MRARSKISTCLWFDDNGLEAADFYVSLIPDSRIMSIYHPDPKGPPIMVSFELGGASFQILNGGPHCKHSEAASIVVTTEDQQETDSLWDALISDGGQESQCGWLKDRFGVSWQVVPEKLSHLLMSGNHEGSGRVMQALMGMRKIDIGALERAFASAARS